MAHRSLFVAAFALAASPAFAQMAVPPAVAPHAGHMMMEQAPAAAPRPDTPAIPPHHAPPPDPPPPPPPHPQRAPPNIPPAPPHPTSALPCVGTTHFSSGPAPGRFGAKTHSTTNAVPSVLAYAIAPATVHVGPSDPGPWLLDR